MPVPVGSAPVELVGLVGLVELVELVELFAPAVVLDSLPVPVPSPPPGQPVMAMSTIVTSAR